MQLSSYCFPGESREELQATAREVIGLELDAKDFEWPEDSRSDSALKSAEHAHSRSKTELGEGRPPVPFGLRTGQQALTIAIFICILSCLVSYLLAKRNLS